MEPGSLVLQADSLPLSHQGSPLLEPVALIHLHIVLRFFDFPGGLDGQVSAYNAVDPGSIPGLGRSPGGGNGTPLQYSCLENPIDGGAY